MNADTNTGHTPGPWSAVCGQSEHKDRYTVGNTHGGIAVVEVVAEIPGKEISLVKQIKNALLIAAAPELLTSAEGVLQIWDDLYSNEADPEEREAWNELRAAISKAKGL